MLPTLRDRNGGPGVTVRVIALLVAVGLVALAAPALVPVVRWFVGLL